MPYNNRPTRRSPGRPKDDGTDRRQIILDAALHEFGLKGYEGASLAQIARGADITKAALLHHFQSKERLFAEVLKVRDLDALRMANEAAAEYSDDALPMLAVGQLPLQGFEGNAWDHLELMVRLARMNEQSVQQVRLFITVASNATSQEGPGYEWLESHMHQTVSLIARGLEEAKARGMCAPEAPSYSIARTVVAIMDGIQLQWALAFDQDPEPWHATSLADELEDYLRLIRDKYEITPEDDASTD